MVKPSCYDFQKRGFFLNTHTPFDQLNFFIMIYFESIPIIIHIRYKVNLHTKWHIFHINNIRK